MNTASPGHAAPPAWQLPGPSPSSLLQPTGIPAGKRAVQHELTGPLMEHWLRQHLREKGTAWQGDVSLDGLTVAKLTDPERHQHTQLGAGAVKNYQSCGMTGEKPQYRSSLPARPLAGC